MIKIMKVKNKREYARLVKKYEILSLASIKYITKLKNFNNIIKLAKEVVQTSFFQFWTRINVNEDKFTFFVQNIKKQEEIV